MWICIRAPASAAARGWTRAVRVSALPTRSICRSRTSPATSRRREVAGDVRDRQMDRVGNAETRTARVHPRAAALAGARIQIHIYAGNDASGFVDHVVEAHILMPDIHIVAQLQHHSEHARYDCE